MRFQFAALLLLTCASSAFAADAAESFVIGYSRDARYFAFEQFGIQDGSGFPYSDIFVLDLKENSWVEGSPIRELTEDESGNLGETRRKSAGRVAHLLDKFAITEPVTILASLPAYQAVADRGSIQYDRWYQLGGAVSRPAADLALDRFELRVEPAQLPAPPPHCSIDDGETAGLSVMLKNLKTGEQHEVYRDQTVPKSRGCPASYDIDKVVVAAGFGTPDRPVAIIGVYSYGFEGVDRRYMAIPLSP